MITREFVPTPVEYRYVRNSNMTSEELSSCESLFNDEWSWGFDEGETAKAFCEGTGTCYGDTFKSFLDNDWFEVYQLQELKGRNIIREEITKEYPSIPYFEFKIEGVNNYSKDIWYEIVIKDGEEPEERSERIRDDLLRFRLVEVVGEEEQEIFTNKNYEDINNERIYVNTISANTKEKLTRTYRIYMWISDSVKVGVGDNIDYDMETWNNEVYASVKINVAGDFVEKDVNNVTPASCFNTQEFDNNGKTEIMITGYAKSCGTDVVIPSKINGHEVTVIGSGDKYRNDIYLKPMAFSEDDFVNSFEDTNLTSVVIPNTVRIIGAGAFGNNNLTKVEIPGSVEWIDDNAFVGASLKEVSIGDGIKYISYAFTSFHSGIAPTYIKKIQIKKTCDEIKNIPASPTELETKIYPFTFTANPDGLDIYGYEDDAYKLCQHFNRNDFEF